MIRKPTAPYKRGITTGRSSNADELDETDVDHLKNIGADHSNHRTASEGFYTDRACFFIRGSYGRDCPAQGPQGKFLPARQPAGPWHHLMVHRRIRPIIVLGPERSGTPAWAEMITVWVAYPGEKRDLPLPDDLNPRPVGVPAAVAPAGRDR